MDISSSSSAATASKDKHSTKEAGDSVPLSQFFSEMDADFVNIKQVDDDTFQYHAQDVLIQSHWELPLVIQYPNSIISYKFASSPGDLSFGIMFVPALEEGQTEEDIDVETLEPVMRTSSGDEMIEGDLEVDSGVIFFLWDNEFDWFSNKYLSYTIQVKQPSFTEIDSARSTKAHAVLKDVLEDIETKSIRLADAEDYIVYSGNEVLLLEDSINRLKKEVELKKLELEKVEMESKNALKVIDFYFDTIAGIGLRCLNQHLLSYVFGFLPNNGSWVSVCKYWNWTAKKCKEHPVDTAEKGHPFEKLKKKLNASSHDSEATATNSEASACPDSSTLLPRPARPNISVGISAFSPQLPPNAIVHQRGIPRQRHHYDEESTSLLSAVTHNESVFLHKPLRSPKVAGSGNMPSARIRTGSRQSSNQKMNTENQVAPGKVASAEDVMNSRAASAAIGIQEVVTVPMSAPPQHRRQSDQRDAAAADSPRLKVPKVAEGKEPTRGAPRNLADITRLKPKQNNKKQQQQGGIPDWKEPGKGDNGLVYDDFEDEVVTGEMERKMIKEVMKMRSNQHLTNLIEYVQAGYAKIEDLETNKRRLKKIFRAWSIRFEKEHGREATIKDKKAGMKEHFEEYEEISAALKVCREKVQRVLTNAGLSYNDFVRLRDRRAAEWKYSVEQGKISLKEFESLASPNARKV